MRMVVDRYDQVWVMTENGHFSKSSGNDTWFVTFVSMLLRYGPVREISELELLAREGKKPVAESASTVVYFDHVSI